MSKEAMKLALEALNDAWGYGTQRLDDKLTKAIKALEEALAKQEQGEPVAWMCHPFGDDECEFSDHQECENCIPLYTTPPQSKEPEQEPVAWAKRAEVWLHDLSNANFDWPYFTNGVFKGDCLELADLLKNLYTTPQQRTWVGLTEDEMAEIVEEFDGVGWDIAPAIEAKLRSKNT